MDNNLIQILTTSLTVAISVGGSALAYAYNSGKQSKAIEELSKKIGDQSKAIQGLDTKIDAKTDKLASDISNVSIEVSYLKGLLDAEKLARK